MKVIGADVLEYVRKLDGKSWNPVSRWTERRAPLVLLHADNGLTGIGEAWSKQDEIARVVDALADFVERRVVGRNFDDADAIRELAAHRSEESWITSAVASGVDIALWDLLAKSRGEPLWKTLGGTSGRVRVYASGGLYREGTTAADLAAEVAGYRVEGFRDIKIKVGGMPLAEDLERVRAVRAAMGGEGDLWVDVVNQLDATTAVAAALSFRAASAAAIQAPVIFDDYATMARMTREALPVVAGEAEHAMRAFENLLATKSIGFLQCNIGLCGGPSAAERIVSAAAARAVPATLQAHGTAVLRIASSHFGAIAAAVHSVEYHRFHDHLDCLADPALRVVDGVLDLGDAAGLGMVTPLPGLQADGGSIRCHGR